MFYGVGLKQGENCPKERKGYTSHWNAPRKHWNLIFAVADALTPALPNLNLPASVQFYEQPA